MLRKEADAGIQVQSRARRAALPPQQATRPINEKSIHLKERIAADAKSGVLDRAGGADRLQDREHRARGAVQQIHLHFGLVGEQLDRAAERAELRAMRVELRDGRVESRRSDGAVIDGAEPPRAMLEVSDLARDRCAVGRDCDSPRVRRDAAISPSNSILPTRRSTSRRMSRFHSNFERVVEVLILAAPAALEVRTNGLRRATLPATPLRASARGTDRSSTRSSEARTVSPGATYGIRTTLPSNRASPSPPYTSFSMVSVSSVGKPKLTLRYHG